MRSGIYKDTTHSHTQRPFCEYRPSSKQRDLNRHSYRQIPMEMYRRRNGGGGLLLGGVGRVGLGRGKLLCREHPLAGPCSLPGLVGVCLGEGGCIGPLPSPPVRALRGSGGRAWLSWWGRVSNPVPEGSHPLHHTQAHLAFG